MYLTFHMALKSFIASWLANDLLKSLDVSLEVYDVGVKQNYETDDAGQECTVF